MQRDSTVANFATVQMEGQRQVERYIDYYNLHVIISVGYRVKSHRGTQFRIWAMGILKEYMKKGFAMDDERLKHLGGAITLMNYLPVSETFVLLKRYSGERYWKSTLQV